MSKDAPRLDGGLIVRKGEATPAVTAAPPTPAPAAPLKAKPASTHAAIPKGIAGTIAVTVRLDPDRYERLKMHGTRKRQTNQEILVAALDAFLPPPETT